MEKKLYLNVYTGINSSIGVIDVGEDFTNINLDELESIISGLSNSNYKIGVNDIGKFTTMPHDVLKNIIDGLNSNAGVIDVKKFTNNIHDKLKSIVVPKLIKVMTEEMGENATVSNIEICSTIPISMIAIIKDEDGSSTLIVDLKETFLY